MTLDHVLRTRLESAGQGALARWIESLDDASGARLGAEVDAVGLDTIATLVARRSGVTPPDGVFTPPPYVTLAERRARPRPAEGVRALREGRVAFALLAGGQASRLQWDGPKGTFPIGPQSERSLFQLLVEHVCRAGREFGTLPRLAVTTAATTDAAIRTFFDRHDCFGFASDRLAFSPQASLPALDPDGGVMLAGPDRLYSSPDGHGGALVGLERNGVLDTWADAGIDAVVTLQVDNPLLRVVDADLIGRFYESGAPVATKIIEKRRPDERLGTVVLRDGRPAIIEYSELPATMGSARDAAGRLVWRLGSIAVHVFSLEFLRAQLSEELPLHVAHKHIPCWGPDGIQRRPALKFERFLFDIFPCADAVTIVEASREEEFAPVKNATGDDSPQTARQALLAKYRRWYEAAGRPVTGRTVELSPLDAVGPADLRA